MINVRKILGYLGNAIFIAGIALGIYALADIYMIKSRLPEGVCPVTKNRPLIYVSVALCAISIVLSFFESKKFKK